MLPILRPYPSFFWQLSESRDQQAKKKRNGLSTTVGHLIKELAKKDEAFLGTSCEVPTPAGEKKIKIPAGVKPGTKIRLKGMGFKSGGKQGDLYAIIEVAIPKELSKRQKEAIETLQDSGL